MLIEQAMYFALGLLVAGLIMLMFLPAIWRRALRLSMRRLQMLAPLSREDAIAERDLLRAEFAVRERRLEQEMAAVKASRTQDLVDIGRHAARIAELDGQLKKSQAEGRELEHQLQDARKTIVERTDLLSSTEMALHEVTERAERGVASLRALRTDNEELGREKEVVLTRVAAHEAKIGDLHQENTDLRRELERLKSDFTELTAEAKRLGDVDAELARVSGELQTVSIAKSSLEQNLAASRAKATEDREKHESEIAHLESALRQARTEARDHADRLETARADNTMLQGAVEALRADHARRRAVDGGADALTTQDVTALRKEISDLATRILETGASVASQSESAPAKRA